MERNSVIAIIVVLGIVLMSSVYVSNTSPPDVPPGKYDGFAQCLTEQGAVMYGTDWCSNCKEQKALFGTSFDYVDYFNCDYNKDACREIGVSGYPTWGIGGKMYPGKQTLEELTALSGCEMWEA
ncbi:MAG: hypothetical protein JXC85_02110 [Candidatus Aenigmarchaeota archaeon]|nr:hypothetical protein [Candidatus Aenigmarchaeota archaeon]